MTDTFLDKKTIAELTARMYLDTGAVRFMTDKPFIFTSGWASPVYNDSRWLISFPAVRSTLMNFTVEGITRDIGPGKLDAVAGGGSAGPPLAAPVFIEIKNPRRDPFAKTEPPRDLGSA